MAIFNRLKFKKIAVQKSQIVGGALPYGIAPRHALLGGILMGLTTAPFNAWPLAWVALAPLWVLVVSYKRPIIT